MMGKRSRGVQGIACTSQHQCFELSLARSQSCEGVLATAWTAAGDTATNSSACYSSVGKLLMRLLNTRIKMALSPRGYSHFINKTKRLFAQGKKIYPKTQKSGYYLVEDDGWIWLFLVNLFYNCSTMNIYFLLCLKRAKAAKIIFKNKSILKKRDNLQTCKEHGWGHLRARFSEQVPVSPRSLNYLPIKAFLTFA